MGGRGQLSYIVAVRALCEFTAKAGDLDLRFTPSPSAQEGMAGHALVASRRNAEYLAELPLAGDYKQLHVRGRADGYNPTLNRLEEVKTYRGDLARMPANHRALHWAQAKVYGWLLCQARGLAEVDVALVYFDIHSQKETVLVERCSADELRDFFETHCERFLQWAVQELAHRAERDRALEALRFPHADFRSGQRELAEAVYKAASTGCCLMAQAPTGIGKTLGTLFPLLKAAPRQGLDRLFFLAAKTPGRQLALDAARLLEANAPGLPLRVLELTARDKACEHPDKACHGESCPLAQGFYDRLPAARKAALERVWLDRDSVREVALEHAVCPYYLAQELARWADLQVGDYNYYFDVSALLHGLTQANQWRVGVLVDEAHNLLERARRMYSAELDQAGFDTLRREAPASLKKPLERINRTWRELSKDDDAPYQALPTLPGKFIASLQSAITDITNHFGEHPTQVHGALLDFYFEAMHFCRMADTFDSHTLFDIRRRPGTRGRSLSTLCLRNLVPAPYLQPRFAATRSTVLFSATLSPRHFHGDLLGLPENTPWVDVQSPFSAGQLAVRVVGSISTRFQHRTASLEPIAELMARQFEERPGNYLAFFSSFDYLQQTLERFAARFPHIPLWTQSRRMDEPARQAFLERFVEGGQGIGFAVLGGAFGEGIDLPGDRLIGAFVATLGLPQLNPVNEQIRQRMDQLFGAGYDYTYLYPGLQKVVQAAGRVIRTREDRGVLYLIDDRFARREVMRLLPGWWKVERSDSHESAAIRLGE
ncbi:ATP-dependent DNA helicase [Pseudomonas indica]|uniref:ATP-dependent DNA helicase n=1 Tax=Pseudomonas indica TaxID=137658 RepID=UPI000BAB9417|nr:ATP-dependent DNA helicase [Pseudomonas indica]PAU58638.1 ATP-dependent DNA helicase [Pseudomonas indica]